MTRAHAPAQGKLLSGDGGAAAVLGEHSMLDAGQAVKAAGETEAAGRRAAQLEEEKLYFDEEFDDLSSELRDKTKKLKKLRRRLRSAKAEVRKEPPHPSIKPIKTPI